MDRFTEQEIAFIIQKKETTDLTWVEITGKYNKKFHTNRDFECIKKCYQRYQNYFKENDNHIRTLKSIHRTKKSNSYTGKENRTILQHWNNRDDLLETIENTIKSIKLQKLKIPKISKIKPKKGKIKDKMTLELLFSDMHLGKQVQDEEGNVIIDLKEIQRRVKRLTHQVIKEIERNSFYFDTERLVVGMLGDLIESAHMHGSESAKGCEFGTSKQVYECIELLFKEFFIPLAYTGILIDIHCITGNHDRIDHQKTYVRPGEDNLTYVIYKTLELLCKQSGLTNIKFHITHKTYTFYSIYNNIVVIEHGDEVRNLNRDTLVNMMNKRQTQLGMVVHFYRIGHWHEQITYGQGRIQVNASITGQDDYSEAKGFDSEALQILNSYCQTNKRKTCFFRSFPIYLEEIYQT